MAGTVSTTICPVSDIRVEVTVYRKWTMPIGIRFAGCLILLCGLTGCLLFSKGHLEISQAHQSRYEQGLAWYHDGRYDEAEQAFRDVLAADPRAVMVKYRLGMTLYHQNRWSGARQQFQQIIGLSRGTPYGYYGMGLIALQGKHRKFEALNWFREALKRDHSFVDAQWQLALTRLSLSNGLFGAFSIGEIRREFERVIALDTEHPEAYYILGTTYYEYGKLDDAELGIPLFEKQIAVNPDHYDALYQLGLAYIDAERISEGIAALTNIRHVNPAWEIKISRAIAEAKLRNAMVPTDSLTIVLRLLPEKERRLYVDLRAVSPSGQDTPTDSLPFDAAEPIARRYWKAYDPTPATAENERLVEHCRRVAYARRYFGRGQWPWDRRGDVYIRFGAPSSRRVFTVDAALESGADPTGKLSPQLGIHQVERWTYTTPPLEFEFVDQGSDFVFDAPLPEVTGDIAGITDQTIREVGVALDDLTSTTPTFYPVEYKQGLPLRFSYSLAVFRGADGRSELEVDYAIPATELAFENETASLETGLTLFDDAWRDISNTIEHHRIADRNTGGNRRTQVALYRRTLSIPPGPHQFAIQITDLQSRRMGVARQPLHVQIYDPEQLAMSDIRLAVNIQSTTDGRFVRGGRRLIPNPAGIFTGMRPVALYFEVYHIRKNQQGRTSITIEYSVFPLTGAASPTIIFVGSSPGRIEQGREFSLIQEEEGTEETLRRDTTIEMINADAGRYALQITVTDHNRNESVEKTVIFQLVR